MTNRIIKIICLLLAMCMLLSVFAGCDKGGKKKPTIIQKVVIDDTDEEESTDQDVDDTDEDEDIGDGTFYVNDDINPSLGYGEGEAVSIDALLGTEQNVYDLIVENGSKPLTDKFRGFFGCVYHPTEFTGKDPTGRYYTDEMLELELTRMKNAGLTHIRTYIYSRWMYTGDDSNPWDFDCEHMQDVYDFIRTVKKHGITPIVVLGSSFAAMIYGGQVYQPEAPYLMPRLLDTDGNIIVTNKWGQYFEQIDYALQNERFADWCAQMVTAFRDHGAEVNNYMLFTEPHEDGGTALGAHYELQLACFKRVHEVLKERGLRESIKLIGPNQSSTRGGLAAYFMQEAPDIFDVYTSHYLRYGSAAADDMYDQHFEVYQKFMQPMEDYGIDKEYWIDEFALNGDHYAKWATDDTYIGVQQCNAMVAMMNAGISGFSAWQYFDQTWPFYYESGGEFWFGTQTDGTIPTLYDTEVPYPSYYATSLMSKYLGSENGKTYTSYAEDDSCGLYIGTVELEDGGWSVVVVNMTTDTKSFNINFEREIGTTLYRYMYSAGTVKPTIAAKVITADKGFKNVKTNLQDTVAGGSVAVYSTIKNFD